MMDLNGRNNPGIVGNVYIGEIEANPVSALEHGDVNDKITYPEYRYSVDLGDRYQGAPCLLDRIEMDKRNWLLGWKRMKRRNYNQSQLEAIIAESQDTSVLLAAALLWVDQEPSEDIFKYAADLAGASVLNDLWEAFFVVQTRTGFVGVVLAIIHYELLNLLNVGEYFPRIGIVEKGGEFYRSYGGRKSK